MFQTGFWLELHATRRSIRPQPASPARQPVLRQGPLCQGSPLVCQATPGGGNYRYGGNIGKQHIQSSSVGSCQLASACVQFSSFKSLFCKKIKKISAFYTNKMQFKVLFGIKMTPAYITTDLFQSVFLLDVLLILPLCKSAHETRIPSRHYIQ